MITREQLVVGAKFRQLDNVTDVEILGIGNKNIFLKHSNGIENLWNISSCLKCLKSLPKIHKRKVLWLQHKTSKMIYNNIYELEVSTIHLNAVFNILKEEIIEYVEPENLEESRSTSS